MTPNRAELPDNVIGGSGEAALFVAVEEGIYYGDHLDRAEKVCSELNAFVVSSKADNVAALGPWRYHSTRSSRSRRKERPSPRNEAFKLRIGLHTGAGMSYAGIDG